MVNFGDWRDGCGMPLGGNEADLNPVVEELFKRVTKFEVGRFQKSGADSVRARGAGLKLVDAGKDVCRGEDGRCGRLARGCFVGREVWLGRAAPQTVEAVVEC
jgi:hypothetical protein